MRFAKFAVLYPLLLAGLVFGRPLRHPRTAALPAVRDLLGLFGEDPILGGGANPIHPATPTPAPAAPAPAPTTNGDTHGPPTHANLNTAPPSNIPTSPSTSGTSTAAAAPALTTQMIGSVVTSSPQRNPVPSVSSSTSADPSYITDASTTPPAELTEWKVIGIAVITITFIATVVLSVTFFDQWWGFVSAALCGKRAKKGGFGETMVPDWKKRSWEFRLASEDGHRYPTMTSLESIVKEKEKSQTLEGGRGDARVLPSPEMAYRCM